MALKYYIEYNDIMGVSHRAEISSDNYSGDATEIKGSIIVSKVSDNDILKATRGGGLKLNLEANKDLTFEDFQTTNEREFLVKYFRDGNIHSIYWLSPEGLFENFVNKEWVVSLDCTDGIGFLNNLQYVDNTTKETFIGKQTMLEVIVNCLKRTNIDMNIYTHINIFHNNQPANTNVLAESVINANRYIKDDNNTVMNCEEVLTSILETFNATITQRDGAWFIYRAVDLFFNSELTFYAYDSDGFALNPATITKDFAITIGSKIDGIYPEHTNSNQQISRRSPIGAYRITYKYGLVKSFFENLDLVSNSGSVDEWTINDTTNLTFPTNEKGFDLARVNTVTTPTLLATSISFTLQAGDLINFFFSMKNKNPIATTKISTNFNCKVILDDSGTLYYLKTDGNWTTTDTFISVRAFNAISNITVLSKELPVGGSCYIEIFRPQENNFNLNSPDITLYSCYYSPVQEQLNDVQGEIFTFKNIENNSTKIIENKTVYNGDSPTDLFVGTIYEDDETTPTEQWYRNDDHFFARTILQMMGEDRMAMYSKFTKIFKGDVFGYVDFLSVITVNNFNELFMPVEYVYNTKDNIVSLKNQEIYNIESNAMTYHVETEEIFDYGETPPPTIN